MHASVSSRSRNVQMHSFSVTESLQANHNSVTNSQRLMTGKHVLNTDLQIIEQSAVCDSGRVTTICSSAENWKCYSLSCMTSCSLDTYR